MESLNERMLPGTAKILDKLGRRKNVESIQRPVVWNLINQRLKGGETAPYGKEWKKDNWSSSS